MKNILIIFVQILLLSVHFHGYGQKIERFELINTQDGLSQNNVLNIFFDSKGYMWLGTMDGLNRYDGYDFKKFKVEEGKINGLSHNRITNIWEDSRKYLWVKTYDGYIHCFIPETEEFITFPAYTKSHEERNSAINSFTQINDDEIWLGSAKSGAYHLQFNSTTLRYQVKRYVSRGVSAVSNNSISFVLSDHNENIWLGTRQGLSYMSKQEAQSGQPNFLHYYADLSFTFATADDQYNYFGTQSRGIVIYDKRSNQFIDGTVLQSYFKNSVITFLSKTSKNEVLIGSEKNGLAIFNDDNTIKTFLEGHKIKNVYEDRSGMLWVNTQEYGITRIDPHNNTIKKHILTPIDIQSLVDDERQFIFEDNNNDLWIALHGGGLAWYNRTNDDFEFYRNHPDQPHSISSNFVHCIAQDQSGLLWVGTGQFNGGLNKVIISNPGFKQYLPSKQVKDRSENVIRHLYSDRNGNIWMATKSGAVYIMDTDFNEIARFNNFPLVDGKWPGANIYTIFEDKDGYIWMGSKGGGILVSQTPLQNTQDFYKNWKFHAYRHDPSDTTTLTGNNIYSIMQDHRNRIWIGEYGGGLNLVTRKTRSKLTVKRFNTSNSSISSNEVRYVFEDSQKRIWVATAFGLNLLQQKNPADFNFQNFFYDPAQPTGLSYNDIIHIFEDSKNRLWFGTFGGGANKLLALDEEGAHFETFTQKKGMTNDAIFSILEDNDGIIWFSTEKGLTKLDHDRMLFENFDRNNGLSSDNFSENSGCIIGGNKLLFGSTNGTLMVIPQQLSKSHFEPPVVFTNFQIFNKDVDIHLPGSPLDKTLDHMEKIVLKHNQSSFSIEYAALSFFDPLKNKYAFILENFDQDWNNVGVQHKATYTNLAPGKYTFKVKASNWDGAWNHNPRVLEIVILSPWYKTTWAYLIYFFSVTTFLLVIWRSYSNYHKLQNDLMVEKRVNEIKLRFFTNISHEIRTPLTLMLGPVEDIRSLYKLPEGAKAKLAIMEKNGKRMLRLVNQLLDFRKAQNNKMKILVQQLNIVPFIRDIVENFDEMAERKKITITLSSDSEDVLLWIDPKRFDSVIFNILSNACKFSPIEGKISIVIDSKNNDHVLIHFADEGPGLTEAKKSLLFQRYTPLSEDDKNSMGNSGIGLSLAYELMKLHKGDILVKSIPGKGSTFTIKVLIGRVHFTPDEIYGEINGEMENLSYEHQKIETEEESPAMENVDKNEDHLVKHKLLIVEDNQDIIDYLKSSFNLEYETLIAHHGKEALRILESFHPDAIVTDVMMPEMDGIEMTKIIKDSVSYSHIPVIMLTAKSTLEDQIIGIESGAEAYILKPFSSEYLKAIVRNLITQRKKIYSKYLDKQEIEPGEIKITSKDDKFLSDVVKLIDENFGDPEFNVEQLVKLCYVSRTVFYNKIKGLTGLSPNDFLRQMRLKIAAKMFTSSDINVSEAANLCGFSDIKYFSRRFKEMFGVNPSEYRNSTKAEKDQ